MSYSTEKPVVLLPPERNQEVSERVIVTTKLLQEDTRPGSVTTPCNCGDIVDRVLRWGARASRMVVDTFRIIAVWQEMWRCYEMASEAF